MVVDGPKAALGGIPEAETCADPEAMQSEELVETLEGTDYRIGCGVKGGRESKGNIMARTSGNTGGHCFRCCHCSHHDVLREEKKTRTIKLLITTYMYM